MKLSNNIGREALSLDFRRGLIMPALTMDELITLLKPLLVGLIPLFLYWLHIRIRASGMEQRLQHQIESGDVKMRAYILEKAEGYDAQVADLERRLRDALDAVDQHRRSENAALDELAKMRLQMRLSQIEVEHLTERVIDLEGQLAQAKREKIAAIVLESVSTT